jgi:uncharacterized protein
MNEDQRRFRRGGAPILSALPYLDLIVRDATAQAFGSRFHGPSHWERVARNGIHLATLTPDADLGVVLAFALIHDAFRLDDGEDRLHGHRASVWAGRVADQFLPDTRGRRPDRRTRVELLCIALGNHQLGRTTEQPTIGCCWDADRLDLGRVGTVPSPEFMSTEEGRLFAAARTAATA